MPLCGNLFGTLPVFNWAPIKQDIMLPAVGPDQVYTWEAELCQCDIYRGDIKLKTDLGSLLINLGE